MVDKLYYINKQLNNTIDVSTNRTILRFKNTINKAGKKSIAEKIIKNCLKTIKKRTGESPMEVLSNAIENVKPYVELKSIRIAGTTHQVPVEIFPERRDAIAIKWIVESARKKTGRTFVDSLSKEITDAYKNQGSSIKKKEDLHKRAESNRAFSHFRW